jgi:cyclopropane-fatty-acyl-phospholipid synthase
MDDCQLIGERFDAVASIGMVEHVGSVQIDRYAQQLAGLLEPGGGC